MHGKGTYTVKGRVGGAQDASGKAGVHVFEGDYLDGARDGQVGGIGLGRNAAGPVLAVPCCQVTRGVSAVSRRAQRLAAGCVPLTGGSSCPVMRSHALACPLSPSPLGLRVLPLWCPGNNNVRQQDSIRRHAEGIALPGQGVLLPPPPASALVRDKGHGVRGAWARCGRQHAAQT